MISHDATSPTRWILQRLQQLPMAGRGTTSGNIWEHAHFWQPWATCGGCEKTHTTGIPFLPEVKARVYRESCPFMVELIFLKPCNNYMSTYVHQKHILDHPRFRCTINMRCGSPCSTAYFYRKFVLVLLRQISISANYFRAYFNGHILEIVLCLCIPIFLWVLYLCYMSLLLHRSGWSNTTKTERRNSWGHHSSSDSSLEPLQQQLWSWHAATWSVLWRICWCDQWRIYHPLTHKGPNPCKNGRSFWLSEMAIQLDSDHYSGFWYTTCFLNCFGECYLVLVRTHKNWDFTLELWIWKHSRIHIGIWGC